MKTIWEQTCFMIDTLEGGGAQNQLLLIARYLKANNLRPYHLIVFREPLTLRKDFCEAGVNVIHVQKNKVFDVIFLYKLFTCLRKISPNVVVTFLITADMWGRLISHIAGVQKIGCSVRSIPQKIGLAKDFFLRLMDKNSDFIVCNSRIAAAKTVEHSRLDQKKVVVIHNGIPPDNNEENVTTKSELTIGLVARLVPLKDVSTLLKAFARIQTIFRTNLVIVGGGPCREALEEEAIALGITEKICFLGERRDAKEIIKTFDIGVLTSKYEGLSNAIMEYMRAGKPVVATRVGGNPELVDDGVTGYLFEHGNVEQLTELLKLLISDPRKATELGIAGRTKIAEHFSVEAMIAKWESILA